MDDHNDTIFNKPEESNGTTINSRHVLLTDTVVLQNKCKQKAIVRVFLLIQVFFFSKYTRIFMEVYVFYSYFNCNTIQKRYHTEILTIVSIS